MALEWSKEISFSGLKKGSPKTKSEYPSKTYMNLTVAKKKAADRKRIIPLAIVLVVVVALVVKFGVLDFFGRVNDAEAELSQHQAELSTLNTAIAGYDDLLEEYESYDTEHMAPDASTVSAMDVMELVDGVVVPHATVESINLTGNVLVLSVSSINLGSTGALVNLLYNDPIVSTVTVSTAATSNQGAATPNQSAADVVATMTITLQREE